jgi:hypothetical protein
VTNAREKAGAKIMSDVDDKQIDSDAPKRRRWSTRQETMEYAPIGSTTLNELIQSGAIIAKKIGIRVVVDLDSVDRYIDGLPNASKRKIA